MKYRNTVEFQVEGADALFADPITRVGGEKCSYHIPTYEALKGILHSIYWKPTLIWVIDAVRVLNPIQTETEGRKPINYNGGNDLSYYTYLKEVKGYDIKEIGWAYFSYEFAAIPGYCGDRLSADPRYPSVLWSATYRTIPKRLSTQL